MSRLRKHERKPPVNSEATKEIISAKWSGPLPTPQALSDFDRIIENGAERIMKMAEQEQQHRFALDNANIAVQIKHQDLLAYNARNETKSNRLGQLLGMTVAVSCIVGAALLAKESPWVAAALVGIPMASVIKAMLPKPNGK